ncbi:ABC transporter permease [Alkalihalobacillus pseudalcaliphilus]|uniref:ABC transporter permease n=1 Tax=Alkalihalobacillus pseudalcaliphilus TaxID=79884 RepID=UPI00064D8FC6|nr:ABC transporter permease [Alkalihalobacillus pseudalcaliphilus]KMK77546.1 hypothetical protein AB990_03510 [Alkalihalobacillus pseudalcaliphilus]
MNTVFQLTRTELIVYFRDWQAAFWTFFFNLIILFVFGWVFGNEPGGMGGEFGFVDMFLPGLIGISIVAIAVFTIGSSVVEYRERAVLKRYLVTPVKPEQLISSFLLLGFLLLLMNALISIVAAIFIFGAPLPANPTGVAVATMLSALAFYSIAFLLFSFVKTVKAAGAIAAIILNFSMILSGAFLPLEIFPTFIQYITYINPLMYTVDVLQGMWLTGDSFRDHYLHLSVLTTMFMVASFLASRFFRWV